TTDDPGAYLIDDDAGAATITVASGGTLAKTGGTDTSTIYNVATTVQGTLKAATGSLVVSSLTLEQGFTPVGDVLAGGTATISGNVTLTTPQTWSVAGANVDIPS